MTYLIEYLCHTGPVMRQRYRRIQPEAVFWIDGAYAFQLWEHPYGGEPAKIGPVYYHPDTELDPGDEGLVMRDRFGRTRPWDAKTMRILPATKEAMG